MLVHSQLFGTSSAAGNLNIIEAVYEYCTRPLLAETAHNLAVFQFVTLRLQDNNCNGESIRRDLAS